MEKVDVLVASTQIGLCTSLQTLLEAQGWINVVATSTSKDDTVRLAKNLHPEVVILDLDLAGHDIDTGKQLLDVLPDLKIIVLSVYDYIGEVSTQTAPEKTSASLNTVTWLSKKEQPSKLLRSISSARKERRIH